MAMTDEGIVLGVQRHGEANVTPELMTLDHGRHLDHRGCNKKPAANAAGSLIV
jgi:recombinational DNA repair protein (RecF pathway)